MFVIMELMPHRRVLPVAERLATTDSLPVARRCTTGICYILLQLQLREGYDSCSKWSFDIPHMLQDPVSISLSSLLFSLIVCGPL